MGVKVEKKLLFAVLISISLFLVSGCEIYDTLYPEPEIQGEVIGVPEGNISVILEGEEITAEDELESILEEINAGLGEEVDETVEDVMEEPHEEVMAEVLEELPEEIIEVAEEEFSEDIGIVILEENEFVSLIPRAEDPDNDALTFTFTSPLDQNGEWQTTYGDNGEYTVTVTASDGTLTSSKEVLIIINKKEEAPVLESFSPQEAAIQIDETETVELNVEGSDLNNDELQYSWKLDGIEVSNDETYVYETTYEDSGSHTVKATITDLVFDTEKIWSVTVENVNRVPELQELEDVDAAETDVIVVIAEAEDFDGDELTFNIDDSRFSQEDNVFTWETDYDDAGTHEVSISVTDGVDTVTEQFTVTIDNVNRAPVILDIIQKS